MGITGLRALNPRNLSLLYSYSLPLLFIYKLIVMTLNDKIQYLLDNGYKSTNHPTLPRYISPNGQRAYSLRDLVFCWESVII
jgi:hypothetical protein